MTSTSGVTLISASVVGTERLDIDPDAPELPLIPIAAIS